jgi:hypothetical protein
LCSSHNVRHGWSFFFLAPTESSPTVPVWETDISPDRADHSEGVRTTITALNIACSIRYANCFKYGIQCQRESYRHHSPIPIELVQIMWD